MHESNSLGNLTGQWDETHVWGKFKEIQLDSFTILREIFVYPEGRTSIHRHTHSSELNFIVGGAIRIFIGEDIEHLHEIVVRQGEMFHVRAGIYHAVRFEESEQHPVKPYARFYEVVHNFNSWTDIERIEAAIPGQRLP